MNIPKLPLRMNHVSDADMGSDGLFAALGYLLVLFFLPLVLRPAYKLGKKCANQGFSLLAIYLVFWLIQALLGWIPVLGFIITFVCVVVKIVDVLFAFYAFYMLYVKHTAIELPYYLNVFH